MSEACLKAILPRCTVCNEQKAPRGAWIGLEAWAMCHEKRGCPGYAKEPDARNHWPADDGTKG